MTHDEYHAWSVQYAATFGMNSDADAAMFSAWFDVFVGCGYAVAELHAARMTVATNPPEYRNSHLAAIHQAVRGSRVRASRKAALEAVNANDRGVCVLCGDTGNVLVPHPQTVSNRQWVGGELFGYRPLAAVTCSCYRGRTMHNGYDQRSPDYQQSVKRPMSYDEYLRLVPNWKELVAAKEQEQIAGDRAAWAAQEADRQAGPLAAVVKRLTEKAAKYSKEKESAA